jgi:bifunctional UDP-N-acetylglucosamine pyrophosphorylase / glucosamine-1-phosphate N-acetyltransferase
MRSERPKPLHRLCGRPMVVHVLAAAAGLRPERIVVVVGHGAARVTKAVGEQQLSTTSRIEFVEQEVQRGTGDAVLVGLTGLPDEYDEDSDVIVLPGDTPLLRTATLAHLVAAHREAEAAATVLTARLANPSGYGRLVRDRAGRVAGIVEQADATEEELAVDEVNTSIYVFRRSLLAPALRRISPNNSQGEYYLTDIVGVLHDAGYPIISVVDDDPVEISGVNDRLQLAAAETELRRRVNEEWLRQGVTMVDPAQTYLDVTVRLGKDVTLYPGTLLQGNTTVASGAEIGPGCQLADCTVGERAVVVSTVGRSARIGADAHVGPWAYLPAGSTVPPGTFTGPCFTGGGEDVGFD